MSLPQKLDTPQSSTEKQVTTLPFIPMKDLTDDKPSAQWLWQGYVARENVTLLTSQWKTGKTTLLAALLAQLKTGGELGGLEVMPGKAIVVSEESPSFWTERNSQLDLSHHILLSRPFRCCLDLSAWRELIEQLAAAHAANPVDLIVIDPLGAFLPGHSETDVTRLKPILAGLRDLADLRLGVLLLHHPRKGAPRPGQASRGSGLLTSFADIIVEMFPLRRADEDDRRRRLQAYSRHPATPLQWVIELNAEGTHFAGLGDVNSTDFLHEWPTVRQLLQEAKSKLSINDLLESWPPISQKPSNTTLWRWLERATREGLVQKRGAGQKNEPNRYWLTGMEEKWQKDPLYTPSFDEIMESIERLAKDR
ncbi:MAG TPA: AAA family ATPase [Gemmataceae bacterium]|nr:AAA family ATPase [Gemmataceae bacterium]